MEKELLLLRKLYVNPELTQRDMAKATGISLGSVNALLKELIKNGVISVQKITRKTMVYKLTPLGLKQKSKLMYVYISEAYAFIKELSIKIDEIVKTHKDDNFIVLFGDKDEIYELIESRLTIKGTHFKYVNRYEEIKVFSEKDKLFVITWNPERYNIIKGSKCHYVNLFDRI